MFCLLDYQFIISFIKGIGNILSYIENGMLTCQCHILNAGKHNTE